MDVRELIAELEKIGDKERIIHFLGGEGFPEEALTINTEPSNYPDNPVILE